MSLWSSSLIPELAQRRCIVFLGAGASAACKDPSGNRPPDWEALLKDALQFVKTAPDKAVAQDLINKKEYLDAAEVIFSNVDPPEARNYFRDKLMLPNYQPSQIHELILEIDPKIVITTNYDQIYDKFCQKGGAKSGYSIVRHHDNNILEEIRSTARLVIKAHGCVTQSTQIVLSRSQYFMARKNHPGFYSVLDSLFLTNTLLFIGCGLRDPDIQMVLENVNIAVPCTHPHYALMSSGSPPAISAAIQRAHNIKIVEYDNSTGDHAKAIEALKELRDAVIAYRMTYP